MKFVGIILLFMVSSIFAQSGELQKADSLYQQFRYAESLPFYQKALELDSNNYEIIWKYCRALVDAGEMEPEKEKQKELYYKASEIIDRAIEIKPDGVEGHLYAAIAYGRRALSVGAKERVQLSNKIRSEAEKAIELDPKNDIAYHVLARWHRKISNLSWIEKKFANMFLGGIPKDASIDKAVEYFRKAIELNPNYINHYLELGITYIDKKEFANARESLDKALSLTAISPRDKKYQQEAKKLLEEIKNKN